MNKEGFSLEERVDNLTKKVKELEERLEEVENPGKVKSNRKSTESNKSKSSNSSGEEDIATDHNYLKKTIKDAKKRYERDHKI